MITTTPAFDAVNQNLAKKPVFVIVIDGYWRVFCTDSAVANFLNNSGATFTFPNGDSVSVGP